MKTFLDFRTASFLSLFLPALAYVSSAGAASSVVDTAQLLSLSTLKATERVLSEHQRLTLETIFVVTYPESPEGGIADEAAKLVERLKADTPRPPNVVVLAIDAEKGKMALRAGLGLDPILGAAAEHIQEIDRVFFQPEWKNGKKNRALILTLIETLRMLESPLVSSGEAIDAYEHAGFSGGWTPVTASAQTSTTWIWMIFGAVVFGFALYRTLAVETHMTGEGWRRVPVTEVLWRRIGKKTAPPLVTGGGVSGNY